MKSLKNKYNIEKFDGEDIIDSYHYVMANMNYINVLLILIFIIFIYLLIE